MSSLSAILFGVLSIAALVVSTVGLIKNKAWLAALGVFLFLPFVYYFSGTPATRIIIVLPFLHFGSAYALYQKNKLMAWSLFSPVIFFMLFVLGVIITNYVRN